MKNQDIGNRRAQLGFSLMLLCSLIAATDLLAQKSDLIRQTSEDAARKSKGCLTCHGGIESMHKNPAVKLGCIDCHLGDADASTKAAAHIMPRFPDRWSTSANPVRSYTLLNKEDKDFLQFVNPGDLRIADRACGSCHNKAEDPPGKVNLGAGNPLTRKADRSCGGCSPIAAAHRNQADQQYDRY